MCKCFVKDFLTKMLTIRKRMFLISYKESDYLNNSIDEGISKSTSCINHKNFMMLIYVEIRVARSYRAPIRETNSLRSVAEELLALHDWTSLSIIPKSLKEFVGFANSRISRCNARRIRSYRNVSYRILPQMGRRLFFSPYERFYRDLLYRESAKAGSARPAAGDAGATCGHGGRRLLPTLRRPSRSCLSLPSLVLFCEFVVLCVCFDRLAKKRPRFTKR